MRSRLTRRVLSVLGLSEILGGGGPARTFAMTALIDAAGGGLFLGCAAILFVQTTSLRPSGVASGFAVAGLAGLFATIPMARLAERMQPRRFLVTTMTARAALMFAYLLVDSWWAFATVAAALTVSAAAWGPAQQALVGDLLAQEQRVVVMGAIRSLRNLGYAAGGLGAAVALAFPGRVALFAVVALDAASFAGAALLYSRLPRRDERPVAVAARRFSLVPDPRYLALAAVSTIYTISLPLLDIGIPLWIAERTNAPRVLAGIVLTLNTVLVVLLQVRVARGADTVRGATMRIGQASAAFAASCVILAAAAHFGAAMAATLVVVGVILLTFGEMLESAGWWTISFELAPEARRVEYLGTFSLNYAVTGVVGPLLMALLIQFGTGAWIATAAVVAVAGPVTRRIASS